MVPLLDRRFLFVVGKGGVGKTTVATAMALAAARKGKRVLIAMANCKERVSHLLEVEPIDTAVVNVAPGVDAVNMSPSVALEEYGVMVLRSRTLYKAVFENRVVRAFLRGTPGIDAWSMLGKAFFHADPPSGAAGYDLVILDAPATGHALDMLRVPQVIVNVAPPGLLRREAERALGLFRDPARAGVVLVTLPEDMPTNETLELYGALTEELMLPVGSLVVNRVLRPLFTVAERPAFEALPGALPEGSTAIDLAKAGRLRALREAVEAESIARLDAIPRKKIRLPALLGADIRRREIEALSRAFD
jgi:anion-transporting  ArsA/GET3 family ATPase